MNGQFLFSFRPPSISPSLVQAILSLFLQLFLLVLIKCNISFQLKQKLTKEKHRKSEDFSMDNVEAMYAKIVELQEKNKLLYDKVLMERNRANTLENQLEQLHTVINRDRRKSGYIVKILAQEVEQLSQQVKFYNDRGGHNDPPNGFHKTAVVDETKDEPTLSSVDCRQRQCDCAIEGFDDLAVCWLSVEICVIAYCDVVSTNDSKTNKFTKDNLSIDLSSNVGRIACVVACRCYQLKQFFTQLLFDKMLICTGQATIMSNLCMEFNNCLQCFSGNSFTYNKSKLILSKCAFCQIAQLC